MSGFSRREMTASVLWLTFQPLDHRAYAVASGQPLDSTAIDGRPIPEQPLARRHHGQPLLVGCKRPETLDIPKRLSIVTNMDALLMMTDHCESGVVRETLNNQRDF